MTATYSGHKEKPDRDLTSTFTGHKTDGFNGMKGIDRLNEIKNYYQPRTVSRRCENCNKETDYFHIGKANERICKECFRL